MHRLPKDFACGQKFNLELALVGQKGGFSTLKHNQVRDTTANLLKNICNDVRIEPSQLSLSEESLSKRTSNIQDNAQVDARMF